MEVRILAVGDVCGEPGMSFLSNRLKQYSVPILMSAPAFFVPEITDRSAPAEASRYTTSLLETYVC